MKNLLETNTINRLRSHYRSVKQEHLLGLFRDQPARFRELSVKWNDFLFDFSKNRINPITLDLFVEMAEELKIKEQIDSYFGENRLNATENRAVLHTALRNFTDEAVELEGKNILHDVRHELSKMKAYADKLQNGKLTGYSGAQIRQIVNIGIGGSHLGPEMVTEALKPYQGKDIDVYFVSNVDPSGIHQAFNKLNPETTLFIVSSKSFTTQETMANAKSAKKWITDHFGDTQAVKDHFAAISTNRTAVSEFGIPEENTFTFWDWVGGRFSLWSSIGLSICLAIGYENFERLLKGAHEADKHFKDTPPRQNIPFIMASLSIWYNNFFGAETHAILPYDQYLHRFPAYLQQAEMESNGKSVDRNGKNTGHQTGAIVWGEPGTNGQHAFFQLMHQGTKLIPADFIGSVQSHNPIDDQHAKLLSSFFAQPEALMRGKTDEEVKEGLNGTGLSDKEIQKLLPYKVFEGNRPSTSILMRKLTPGNLGSLIAFYEHKIFVQGLFWNIYSFDQWGVELGKTLAKKILPELTGSTTNQHDGSTKGLIEQFKKWKK